MFLDSNLTHAVNCWAYGTKMKILFKGSKKAVEAAAFVSDEDLTCLQILCRKKNYSRFRIHFKDISILSDNPSFKLPKDLANIQTILFVNTMKDDHMVLVFPDFQTRDLIWQSLQWFMKNALDLLQG